MNKTLDVLDCAGKKVDTVELPESIFDVDANVALLHQVVNAQLAAARLGTHKTKNRGERSGSGRKPFKQKGTGNARQGSVRMPQHRGGGIVHGPVPRDYSQRTPKKMVRAALNQSLSNRARAGQIHIFASFVPGSTPSTRNAVSTLQHTGDVCRYLLIVDDLASACAKSVINLPYVHLLQTGQLNAMDVLKSDRVVFTKRSFDAFVTMRRLGV